MVCDLEHATLDQVASLLDGAEAVVFAAGAGPGRGAARKETVDRAAAVLAADAAERAGVRRFVQISSMGAGSLPHWAPTTGSRPTSEPRRPSTRTVTPAISTGPCWGPGRLTNEPGTGRVRLGLPPLARGAVSRDDVAAVIATLLVDGRGIGHTLELVHGDTPIADASSQL